jgi:Ni/Fe-hydrogenase subunit HybB-like protein
MAILQLLLAVICAVGLTVVGLALVRPFVRRNVGPGHNEMSGAIFVVAGTIYAVFVAFVVITSWAAHDNAEAIAADEASQLATLYRASVSMEHEAGDRLRGFVRQYTEAVITDEWKLQERGGASEKARTALLEIYRLFGVISPETRRDDAAIDQAQLTVLAQVQASRTKRTLLAGQSLSPVIWWTAIVNGVLVMLMSFFLYSDRHRPHGIMCGGLATIIVVLLYVISLFAKPFGGLLPLGPDDFAHAVDVYDSVDRAL